MKRIDHSPYGLFSKSSQLTIQRYHYNCFHFSTITVRLTWNDECGQFNINMGSTQDTCFSLRWLFFVTGL